MRKLAFFLALALFVVAGYCDTVDDTTLTMPSWLIIKDKPFIDARRYSSFSAALAVAQTSSHSTLLLGTGTYVCPAGATITQDITIVGMGRDATLLVFAGNGISIQVTDVCFRDMAITGTRTNALNPLTGTYGNVGLRLDNSVVSCGKFVGENLDIYGFDTNILMIGGVYYCTFDKCLSRSGNYGLVLVASSTSLVTAPNANNWFGGNISSNASGGVVGLGGTMFNFIGSALERNGKYSSNADSQFPFYGVYTKNWCNLIFQNCWIENNFMLAQSNSSIAVIASIMGGSSGLSGIDGKISWDDYRRREKIRVDFQIATETFTAYNATFTPTTGGPDLSYGWYSNLGSNATAGAAKLGATDYLYGMQNLSTDTYFRFEMTYKNNDTLLRYTPRFTVEFLSYDGSTDETNFTNHVPISQLGDTNWHTISFISAPRYASGTYLTPIYPIVNARVKMYLGDVTEDFSTAPANIAIVPPTLEFLASRAPQQFIPNMNYAVERADFLVSPNFKKFFIDGKARDTADSVPTATSSRGDWTWNSTGTYQMLPGGAGSYPTGASHSVLLGWYRTDSGWKPVYGLTGD